MAGALAFACVQAKPAIDTGDPGYSIAGASTASPSPGPTAVPGASPSPDSSPSPAATQTIAYTDLQAMFAGDCVSCHSDRNARGNYSMSSYQAVMKDVRPGDASCALVVTTQPSGSMYRYWSGNRTTKATTVFDWVVKYRAAQTR